MLRQTHDESEEERTALPAPNELLEDDDSMNLSDDSPQIFNPPPRIAARFYRPTNSRRKSSAASSRRNSISSTHSHQSNRSYHGGCQSNHVAQHLRRASILESRKARLADRAAHAEQVRLRAALAKAAPRSSNTEEKALAAQQAREKRLAEIAAACAEEVRRAKKVAEDMKERKAAEERRYRLEMEEKLVEAEKRRLEYKKNSKRPRTTSVPAPDKKSPSPDDDDAIPAISTEEATKRIQKAWRMRQRGRAVEGFLEMGLSIDRVHDASFEEVSSLLADEKLLTATSRVLHVFGLKGSDGSGIPESAAVRTFLSAYLILGHPTEVLSKDGHQEQDLITKAKDLIISFESALSKISSSDSHTPTPTHVETVHLAHGAFVTAFSDWKARDSSALVETMVASFVNLDAIWQSVKDDTSGAVAEDYRQGIRDNQVILLSKIRKLAGPDRANFLIKKAVTESRRARARKRPRGDVRPRAALETPSPPETAEPEAGSPSQKAASRLDSLRERDEQQHDQVARSSSGRSSQSSPTRPPLDASLDALGAQALGKLFSALPPNRVLTHELAIDREYRINVSPRSHIGDAVNRAVCDSMLKGFQTGQGDVWTAAMAENIRAKLLRLLKPGNSMHTLISETLDPEHVQRQCQQGVFSYEKFFSFMSTILPKLCAPFRDEQVKTLAEELEQGGSTTDMIERLFKLLHVIDLLSLDYQNFLLMNAAPTLIREAAGYEQRMFAQDLETGVITLQKTRRWWSNASVNVLTESYTSLAAATSSTSPHDPSRRPTPQKIYSRGLVDLAIATTPLHDADIPETLQLDRARLTSMRADAVRITTIGAILLTAKNLLKRDVRAAWKPEAARLWELLKDTDAYADEATPGRVLATIESAHTLPPATRAQLASTIARLLAQARDGRLSDPVAKVLFARLKSHVFGRISASSSGEKVRAASTASEGLAATGLPEFVAHVGEIVEVLGRIGDVDRRAHEGWYQQVQMEVERMGSEE